MGVNINIRSFECRNQLRNGSDFSQNTTEFTPNLVGNVGEKVQVAIVFTFNYDSFAEVDNWFLQRGRIQRSSGNFLLDGMQIGDTFSFFEDWSRRYIEPDTLAPSEFSASIDSISSDGKIMTYTITEGNQLTVGNVTNVGIIVNPTRLENAHTGLLFKFGLLSNTEQFRFTNNVTDAQQVYYTGELEHNGNVFEDLFSLSENKDWVTGNMRVFTNTDQNNTTQNQFFVITHEFIITPYWLASWNEFLESGEIPPLLAGNNSLKYSYSPELRKTLTDIASSKSTEFNEVEGVVGYFGQNFNGFNNFYNVVDVVYTDNVTQEVLEGININSETRVRVTIQNLKGNYNDFNVGIYLSRLPADSTEYINTPTTFVENFLYDNATITWPATDATIGTPVVFKSMTRTVNGDQMTIDAVLEYSFEQKLKLNEGDRYLLFCQVEDDTLLAGNSDKASLLADWGTYQDFNFVGDFVEYSQYGFYTHEMDIDTDQPLVQLDETRNESGIILKAKFGIDLSKEVVINAIALKLLALNENTNSFFELDNYNIDLSNQVVSNGIQEFNIEIGRGYELLQTDPFNIIKLNTAEKVGDIQFYELIFPQKLRWQDWIRNDNVDEVFYDNTKPNENLNFKTSNYSGKQDYIIKLGTNLTLTGIDDLGRNVTGDVTQFGGTITTADYDEGSVITGVLETFDPDSNAALGGAVLYNGKDTLLRATFTQDSAQGVGYAIHRIEVSQSIGDGIFELSNIRDFPANNLLKPLNGESLLKVTVNGLDVITESLIDGNKIQDGVNYKLSAEFSQEQLTPCLQFFASNPDNITVSPPSAGFWIHSGGISSLYCFNGRGDVTAINACDAGVSGTVDLSSSEWTSLVYVCFDNANNLDLKLGDWINQEGVSIQVQNAYFNKDAFEALITEVESVNDDMNVIPNRDLNCGNVLVDLSQFPDLQQRIDDLIALGWNITIVNQKALTIQIGESKLVNFDQRVTENSGQELWVRGNQRLVGEVQVNVNDNIEMYHSSINDIVEINCNELGGTFLFLENELNIVSCKLTFRLNNLTQQSINSIKQSIEEVGSNITIDINSMQLHSIYSDAQYLSEIVEYVNNDRLLSHFMYAEFINPKVGDDWEGDFFIPIDDDFTFSASGNALRNTLNFYKLPTGLGQIFNNLQLTEILFSGPGVLPNDLQIGTCSYRSLDMSNIDINSKAFLPRNTNELINLQGVSGVCSNFDISNCNISGPLDISNCNLIGILNFSNNNVSTLTGVNGVCTLFKGDDNMLSSLDLTNLTINGSFTALRNSITYLIGFTGNSFGNELFLGSNDITGTFDLRGNTFNNTTIGLFNNPNLTEVIIDLSQQNNINSVNVDQGVTVNYI